MATVPSLLQEEGATTETPQSPPSPLPTTATTMTLQESITSESQIAPPSDDLGLTSVGQKRAREDESTLLEEKKWPGWPGENVFRLIVPVSKVGSIIGRKGELVKKMCEETRSRIKVLDGVPGTLDRVVSILILQK